MLPMRKWLLTPCILLILAAETFAQTFRLQYDGGVIEEMYGDTISVVGSLGYHVFEIVSPCSWCDKEITVAITFEGFTRATMTPVPNILDSAPVKMFIIRDGRE